MDNQLIQIYLLVCQIYDNQNGIVNLTNHEIRFCSAGCGTQIFTSSLASQIAV